MSLFDLVVKTQKPLQRELLLDFFQILSSVVKEMDY